MTDLTPISLIKRGLIDSGLPMQKLMGSIIIRLKKRCMRGIRCAIMRSE
jgi:hypothetical protein